MRATDLLGEQRAEPERQRHDAVGAKAQPQPRQPIHAEGLGIALDIQLDRLLRGLQPQFVELEEILIVGKAQLALAYGHVAQQVGLVFLAVPNIVDGIHRLDVEQLVFHDPVQLVAAAAEYRALCQADDPLLELGGTGHLRAGKRAFYAGRIVWKIHAEEVPAFVGHFVALEIQRFRVAVGDLLHAARGPLQLVPVFVQVFVTVRAYVFLLGLLEAVAVEVKPVQAGAVLQVEFVAPLAVVDQQAFLDGATGQQQVALVPRLGQILFPLLVGIGLVGVCQGAQVQIVPVGLLAVALGDLGSLAGEAQGSRTLDMPADVFLCFGLVIQGPDQRGQVACPALGQRPQ